MKPSRLLLIVVLLTNTCFCFSQGISDELKSWLSTNELSKIKKAELRIDQGEQILFSHQLRNLTDTIVKEEVNYLSLSQNLVVDKKFGRLLMETKEYFATGFGSKLEIYKKYLDHYTKIDTLGKFKTVHALNDSIDIYISDANFYSDKSGVKGNLIIAANAVHKSNVNLQSAVLLCEKALLRLKNRQYDIEENVQPDVIKLVIQSVDKEKEEVRDGIVPVVVEKKDEKEVVQAEPETIIAVIEKDDVKQEEKTVEPKKAVYFTVQILADKKPVSDSKIRTIYKGSLPVVENQGDGWYRYSLGKFDSYPAAKKALAESQVKGYVVAYKNSDRISVREAISLISK